MHNQDFFFQALIYLLAAVISVPVAKRLGLGSVLGYLLAGIIIGPYVLELIGEEGADIMHFAEFGVVIMLFLIGLELKPSLLWKMRKSIFGLGGLQVVITAIVITVIAWLFKLQFAQAVAIGLIFSLSSTAIVLQTLGEKGQLKQEGGKASFSVLLFQDIAVIPILAFLPLLGKFIHLEGASHVAVDEHHGADVSDLPGYLQILIISAIIVAIIIGGRFLARYMFRIIANTGLREIFTAAALLIVIAIAIAMDSVGLSPALGTFLAGVVLSDNEYRHELESDIEPFKSLLLGLFFIAVGASINFVLLLEKPLLILALLGILIFVKLFILYGLSRLFKIRAGQGTLFTFALAQGGEFAFVLITFSQQNAILSGNISELLLIVVAISMATTPFLMILNDKVIMPMFDTKSNEREADKIENEENKVIISGFGRYGVLVGRFLRANGIPATILDNDPNKLDTLRKFGFKVYYGDASRPDLLDSAGIASAEILVLSMDDHEKIVETIDYVKKKYPHVKIFARANNIRNSFDLKSKNISYIRRETYDSSLEMGTEILRKLGFDSFHASRLRRTFKHHDELIMDELYTHWGEDRDKYIKEANRFSQELENILLADHSEPIHHADDAWDSSSLREEVKDIYEEFQKKNK
ncbi:MAG: monovalent cation:proton antiporter-2 (CPA2) family protein [Bacteroidales bacterium]|nr:monovalent cation:proton antiporter-2 (CPA2) family protein [Bacteroidales bacterium]